MKFLVDMPLPPALARWLAAQGHDAVHADAVGLGRSTDREILTRARLEAANRGDRRSRLAKVAGSYRSRRTKPDPIRGGDWSEPDVTARMQQILHVMGEGEITRGIVAADRTRVRRRRLPIN